MTFSRITVHGFTLFPALSDESTLHLLSYNTAEDLYKNYRLVTIGLYRFIIQVQRREREISKISVKRLGATNS